MKKGKSREQVSINTLTHYTSNLKGLSCSSPVLGFIAILTLLPAMIYGCSSTDDAGSVPEAETPVRIMENSITVLDAAQCIDVLIFNDDRLRRLDTYQRFDLPSCSTVKASSTTGNKMMTVFVNSRRERYGWAEINSYQGLSQLHVDLEDESREYPAMTGECRIRAGSPANIMVDRLVSEIVLRSINCDFSSEAYSGFKLKDVRVYLTNVSAEAPLSPQERYIPSRIINHGKADDDDMDLFEDPSLIMQDMEQDIGPEIIWPDIRLRCYPNQSAEESPGTPFTRIIIEGSVDGTTYYWPININRDAEGDGVGRNRRYIYDIRIRRTGHSDPDTPVQTADADISMEIQSWEEKQEYGVRF